MRVHDCELWGPVVRGLLEGREELTARACIELQRRHLGASPAKLAAIHRGHARRAAGDTAAIPYAELLADLYAAVGRATGADVIVDSSKHGPDAYLISMLLDIDMYVLHLVRDPRATAYAWGKRKRKSFEPVRYFAQVGPLTSSWRWLRRNAVIEALVRRRQGDRYLLMRYEDFVADPQAAVRSICSLVGEAQAELPFVSERTVRIGPNHTVGGNPARFDSGEVQITPDDEWRSALTRRSKLLATVPTAPLLRRYNYPLLP